MTILGASLMEIAAASRIEFTMCAPFAKEAVVSRVLSVIPDGVQIALFTRWRPDEVAAGVSDTAVLPLVRSRGGTVYLHDRLHAKYYRNETEALIGSANLTATALGWSQNSNLELLVSSSDHQIYSLETTLVDQSIVATYEIAQQVDKLAAQLPMFRLAEGVVDDAHDAVWIPRLRMPSDLYAAYAGRSKSLATRSAQAAATDLAALDLPCGLDREQFDLLVGDRLRNQQILLRIDELLVKPRRFGEMRDFLASEVGMESESAEQSWQTILRWMLEFLPKRYLINVYRHSEVVSLAEADVATP